MISPTVKASFVGADFYANDIFDVASLRNRDNCLLPFFEVRKLFIDNGVELNSVDINRDDCVQFELHLDVQKTLKGNIPKYVMLYESPQVRSLNQSKLQLAKYRLVFTWRDDLVDGQKYIKFNLPNKIVVNNTRGWDGRNKFCCLISANKSISQKTLLELYSERVKTIRWFEKNAPHAFDLYGGGWGMPAAKNGLTRRLLSKLATYLPKDRKKIYFPSYRGKVVSKLETMQHYRFSICYENVCDLPGYITEKIWDSFFAGCVPVYWGASNITDYIPENCFIDRRKFVNHDDLYKFMDAMTELEHTAYQERIAAFLITEKAHQFSAEAFAATIVNTIMRDLELGSVSKLPVDDQIST